ncbi:hypothetical protein NP233_g9420 [Leucocoprinus birnbaumii]|uniref:Protein kinase domain-containing protein n=1 Tax=Leucocoprinus birnbaumii TaxID=56174 RepID=A0AAD5VMS0_9AGAR|nr:hypothetical protein NP233_g9420 [Leucocoprinus birnbaumii]
MSKPPKTTTRQAEVDSPGPTTPPRKPARNVASNAPAGNTNAPSTNPTTPRAPKQDGGDQKQSDLRKVVVNQMVHEIRRCTIEDFLDYYAPFRVSPDTIATARQLLAKEGHVEEDKESGEYQLTNFGRGPGNASLESQMFEPLEEIVAALGGVECHDLAGSVRTRRFHYRNCANTSMESEISGTNFRVDAAVSMGATPKGSDERTVISETAVPLEFKRNRSDDSRMENREQLVGAANQIMNDDPRRMWMYGITIEAEKMAVWYFSRSHSVKCTSFDFSANVDLFIAIMLSLLFSTDKEMGYDPTVHRVVFNNEICYVYEVGPRDSPTYWRTITPIYNPRVLCITGKKTRVWRAVQVSGLQGEKLQELNPGNEVALKDVWLDKDAPTEKEIQQQIFKKLDDISPDKYAWARPAIRDRIQDAIANKTYKWYFMEIETDFKGEVARAPSGASGADPSILGFGSTKRKVPGDDNVVRGSTQYSNPSMHTGVRLGGEGIPNRAPRQHLPKQQYRVVYKHVGTALHDCEDLPATFSGLLDVYFALVLLFLSGWVHRDISTGNILIVKDRKSGRSIGKLSDLEYAKGIENQKATPGSLKTGTPFFMSLEIHSGQNPCVVDASTVRSAEVKPKNPDPWNFPAPARKKKASRRDDPFESLPPRHRFHHDLESLWWIIVWLLLVRVDFEEVPRENGQLLEEQIFTHQSMPNARRARFFKEIVKDGVTHPDLADAVVCLNEIRAGLVTIYQQHTVTLQDYHKLYESIADSLSQLVQETHAVDVKLRPLKKRSVKSYQQSTRSSTALDKEEYVPGSSAPPSEDGHEGDVVLDEGPGEVNLPEEVGEVISAPLFGRISRMGLQGEVEESVSAQDQNFETLGNFPNRLQISFRHALVLLAGLILAVVQWQRSLQPQPAVDGDQAPDWFDRLLLYAIRWFTAANVVQFGYLLIFAAVPRTAYWLPFHLCAQKLYINAFLNDLNSRPVQRRRRFSDFGDTFPRRSFVNPVVRQDELETPESENKTTIQSHTEESSGQQSSQVGGSKLDVPAGSEEISVASWGPPQVSSSLASLHDLSDS